MAKGRCSAIKADGGRCNGVPVRGSQWCASHHPDTQQARRQGSKKGGKRGGRGRTGPADLRDVQGQIRTVIAGVLNGGIGPAVGAVAFQGFNVLLRSIDGELRIREHDELNQRVEELEEALQSERQRGGHRYGSS